MNNQYYENEKSNFIDDTANGYVEMGSLNLLICDEFSHSEVDVYQLNFKN